MGVLATASLLALTVLSAHCFKIGYQNVQNGEDGSRSFQNFVMLEPVIQSDAVTEAPPTDNAAHSANVAYSSYQAPLSYDYSPPNELNYGAADYKNLFTTGNTKSPQPQKVAEFDSNEFKPVYEIQHLHDLEAKQEPQKFGNNGFAHYKTSKSVNREGPHQIETIETRSFHKEVPRFEISQFDHKTTDEHGETHYHKHKHYHTHDHKQEHVHQHKQDHKHAHEAHHKHGHDHKNQHTHAHHADHTHGHEHKQQHKHDHSAKHEHGHKHTQEHKHSHLDEHKHGHDHKHMQGHKHDHHHDHSHHQDHKHDHKHGHKHENHHDHKHGHHHGHKHGHHQVHKHGHDHKHKHGHHEMHKHKQDHWHKHGHKSSH